MKLAVAVFLLIGAAFAQAPTRGDMPLPKPVAVIPVEDTGPKDAPAICIGTGNAYVKPQPGDQMMTWVEETNLSVKNVSDKDIQKLTIKLSLTDVRDNGTDHIWYIDHKDATKILPAGKIWDIGQGKHWSGARPTVSTAEYTSTPEVKPAIHCHVDLETFTDGSTWVPGASPEPSPE